MKVMWLLEELGLPHERIDAGGQFGGTATPEYRAMNPLGLVPAIRDGALSLFESNAILRYLCRAHAPASGLYPADPAQAAPVDAWLDFQQTSFAGPAGRLFTAVVRTPPERRDQAALGAALAETSRLWGLIDAQLESRDHVAAPQLTIADMALGPSLHRWFAMPIDRPELPRLRAWYDRLAARPAYARSCMGPLS
jgi:glutathione S-transferase